MLPRFDGGLLEHPHLSGWFTVWGLVLFTCFLRLKALGCRVRGVWGFGVQGAGLGLRVSIGLTWGFRERRDVKQPEMHARIFRNCFNDSEKGTSISSSSPSSMSAAA